MVATDGHVRSVPPIDSLSAMDFIIQKTLFTKWEFFYYPLNRKLQCAACGGDGSAEDVQFCLRRQLSVDTLPGHDGAVPSSLCHQPARSVRHQFALRHGR